MFSLIRVSVWQGKPVAGKLYVNIHCCLLCILMMPRIASLLSTFALCIIMHSKVEVLELKLDYLRTEREKKIENIKEKGKNCIEKYGKKAGKIGVLPGGCIPFVHGICISMMMELGKIVGINASKDFASDIFANAIVGIILTPLMVVPGLSTIMAEAYVETVGEDYFDVLLAVIERSTDEEVLSEEDCNIALIYDRKMGGCNVSLGVVNTDERQSDPSKSNIYINRLASALSGNFPGVEIRKDSDRKSCFKQGIPKCLEKVTVEGENTKSVAIVSNLASEKSEGFISQSMEKLLDGIVPKSEDEEYTIVLLAKPIVDQLGKKNRLFEMYSALNPYASWQTNYTSNISFSIS